jgi:Asparagine synthase/Glutamine amidotransferase domain
MSVERLIQDLRVARGRVWNVDEVRRGRFRFGPADAPWNQPVAVTEEAWLDEFVYQGYRAHGVGFLAYLKGRFAVAHVDSARQRLFLARDWIGEMPLHFLATPRCIFAANTVGAIKRAAGEMFSYAYVRCFPQAHAQEIDLADVEPDRVSFTMRAVDPILFRDFGLLVRDVGCDLGYDIRPATLREHFHDSIRRRAQSGRQPHAVLLSGGLDSFSVALAMKICGIHFEAYTLSVNGAGDDVSIAAQFAHRLGVTHHVIRVAPKDVVDVFEEAVVQGEYYPLYNVYCAAGMVLLAHDLVRRGIRSAFCGEAVNEAVGDYKDWEVLDPRTGCPIVLQRINSTRLQRTEERQTLVWGHPHVGPKFNRQLGSGLAKHAGSRMVKPFLSNGLTLECPYYEPHLLAHLVAIPPEVLEDMGGKSGLFARVFDEDLRRFRVDRSLIESCKKVRLQDASEGGQGGITAALLAAGCDQKQAIELFNREFGAALDPEIDGSRLAWSVSGGLP